MVAKILWSGEAKMVLMLSNNPLVLIKSTTILMEGGALDMILVGVFSNGSTIFKISSLLINLKVVNRSERMAEAILNF